VLGIETGNREFAGMVSGITGFVVISHHLPGPIASSCTSSPGSRSYYHNANNADDDNDARRSVLCSVASTSSTITAIPEVQDSTSPILWTYAFDRLKDCVASLHATFGLSWLDER